MDQVKPTVDDFLLDILRSHQLQLLIFMSVCNR